MTAHKQDSIPSVGILLLQYIPTHTHAYYAYMMIITRIQYTTTITIHIYIIPYFCKDNVIKLIYIK